MKYFSKEYVEEADCEEMQEYRKVLDYCCDVAIKTDNHEYKKNIYKAFSRGINNVYLFSGGWDGKDVYLYKRSMVVWLPTGDQLEEEIEKICDEKRYEYAAFYSGIWVATIEPIRNIMNGVNSKEFKNLNPLIAKIRLLKQLLKQKG